MTIFNPVEFIKVTLSAQTPSTLKYLDNKDGGIKGNHRAKNDWRSSVVIILCEVSNTNDSQRQIRLNKKIKILRFFVGAL